MSISEDKDLSTKETILKATLELIKEEGLENVTLRKITAKANVNLALVNYYFGSKDYLISEALKTMLGTFGDAMEVLDDESLAPIDRYKQFLINYVRLVQQHPELLHQLLGKGDLMFATKYDYIDYLKKLGMSKVRALVEEITGETDPETLFMITMQINAAVFFPVLITTISPKKAEVFPKIPVEKLVDHLFDHYFARYSARPSD